MGRSPCCEKDHTKKGAWSKEEDQVLIAYIQSHGEGCRHSLPKAAGLQHCDKRCRLRWINYLRSGLKRGNFCPEEDELINKWSMIASMQDHKREICCHIGLQTVGGGCCYVC